MRAVRISSAVIAVLVMGLGAAMGYLFLGAGAVYQLQGVRVITAVALAGGVTALVLLVRARLAGALIAIAATLIALHWSFVLQVLPSFERYKPAPGLAQVLEGRLTSEDVVASYNVAVPSLVYYLRRRIEPAYNPEPIRQFLDSRKTAYVILPREDYAVVDGMTSTPTCIVSTHPTFDVKLRNILAREPLPDLLVITNRCGG